MRVQYREKSIVEPFIAFKYDFIRFDDLVEIKFSNRSIF
jgi:hypothetical protein